MPEAGEGPMQAAQRLMRPDLPKRFYDRVETGREGHEFNILLDGRPVRTPARRPLTVASEPLANALAEEWRAQEGVIDPAFMPLTKLVNSALDGVTGDADPVRREIRNYAGTDLLCYRADGPSGLVARQNAAWDPVMDWADRKLGVRLSLADGIVHVEQPTAALAAISAVLAPLPPLRLAAVSAITTLTGSALLALAVLKGGLSPEAAWEAAHVDEDWNIAQWGADDEAMVRRAAREGEMMAAARLLALTA